MKNPLHNVFEGIPSGDDEAGHVARFAAATDLRAQTAEAIHYDLRKFAKWFVGVNHEPFRFTRVSVSDVVGLREYLRREKGQAVATCNRLLVNLRRIYQWLHSEGLVDANPAKAVRELRRQPLAPKGLDRVQTRRLLREMELRGDVRAAAIFSLMLHAGARVSDVVQLELCDLLIADRSGHAVFRHGKGGKERTVPLGLPTRNALTAYLGQRPPVQTRSVFVGERGSLTSKGVDKLCGKYSAICGFRFHAHLLRHSFCHAYLEANNNDLVGLAQLCGHESLNTTMRYSLKGQASLAEGVERAIG